MNKIKKVYYYLLLSYYILKGRKLITKYLNKNFDSQYFDYVKQKSLERKIEDTTDKIIDLHYKLNNEGILKLELDYNVALEKDVKEPKKIKLNKQKMTNKSKNQNKKKMTKKRIEK
ncbi:MAG: hypothetical protein PHU05_05090 [Bacilli bacterium]|nr:hypothetical protein [Bacilli bacterium]